MSGLRHYNEYKLRTDIPRISYDTRVFADKKLSSVAPPAAQQRGMQRMPEGMEKVIIFQRLSDKIGLVEMH
jgi:hypothetical protein